MTRRDEQLPCMPGGHSTLVASFYAAVCMPLTSLDASCFVEFSEVWTSSVRE
jgi:hypothetical protein